MKFHAECIDERGAVVRRVLSANDREHAREMLLNAEGWYAKRLEPVPDDTPVSWAPRDAGVERLRAAVHGQLAATPPAPKLVAASLTTLLALGDRPARRGTLTVYDTGRLVFDAATEPRLQRVVEPSDVELAAIVGFPMRRLAVSLLSGELLEFSAGPLMAGEAFRRAVSILRQLR